MTNEFGIDPKKRALMQEIVETMPDLVNTLIHLNGLIADRMGVVPSDFQCLHVIAHGPTTASVVAARVALTPGSVSRAIDRLEAARCVRRIPDPSDRRRTLVEATAEGLQKISGYYDSLTNRTQADLSTFSRDELGAILRFVNASRSAAADEAKALRHG